MSKSEAYRIRDNKENLYILYEKLLNQVQDVAWVSDIDIKTLQITPIYISPSCKSVYEFTQEELLNSDIDLAFNCVTPRSHKKLMSTIKESIETGNNGRCHGNYLTPKTKKLTKQRWCWTTEKNSINIRFYGTTTDVTKEFESITAKAAQEVAEIENKKKRTFLERTCHEQRNLHMGVSGGSELALDYIHELETDMKNMQRKIIKTKDIIDIIADSSEHINHLLDTTLSLQQMESEHFSYTYDFYDIQATIDSCTKQLAHVIKSSVVGLNIHIDRMFKDILIRYDNTKIIQAIMNYLSNAYKYTDEGSIKLDIGGKHKTDTIDITIEITDTGIGIGKNTRLFELYKQHNSLRGGSGIGLYLVKRYIEDGHDGIVSFISEENKGSTFFIKFNCQYKQKNHSSYESIEGGSPLKSNYKDILLVEDMNSNRLLIGTMLMNLGYQYDDCKNGSIALEMLDRKKYGLILSDRKMPTMDGIELTKLALKRDKNQIIIGITGNSIKDQVTEWLDIGVKSVITKPCSKAKLKCVLEKYIRPICSSGSGI